jgi:hypothetical protein
MEAEVNLLWSKLGSISSKSSISSSLPSSIRRRDEGCGVQSPWLEEAVDGDELLFVGGAPPVLPLSAPAMEPYAMDDRAEPRPEVRAVGPGADSLLKVLAVPTAALADELRLPREDRGSLNMNWFIIGPPTLLKVEVLPRSPPAVPPLVPGLAFPDARRAEIGVEWVD